MKIAVIGAGFCGLAVAWHLVQSEKNEIVVFDSLGIGKGTSGIAAGLLHPYAGAHAKKNFRAIEGMQATLKLINEAEKTLKSAVIVSKGLIRPAVNEQQKADFTKTALVYPDVHWLTPEECAAKLRVPNRHPGIFIDSGIVVDCAKYLQGLWNACMTKGAAFVQKKVKSLEELAEFDTIIIAMGAAAKSLSEISKLNLTPIKGQILEMTWPEKLAALSYPVASQGYIIMQEDGRKCITGATFERNFENEATDIETAKKEILPKVQSFLPQLDSSLIVGCRAGIRASTQGHLPLMEKINTKTWLLTGMGSKGLLYHALYAEELVSKIKRY
jgi:glycine/D-amino acid oxidase-like deaminating enzyme